MLNEKLTTAQRATLIGLTEVAQRTEKSAPLRYLNKTEVDNVLSLDAHGYNDERLP